MMVDTRKDDALRRIIEEAPYAIKTTPGSHWRCRWCRERAPYAREIKHVAKGNAMCPVQIALDGLQVKPTSTR